MEGNAGFIAVSILGDVELWGNILLTALVFTCTCIAPPCFIKSEDVNVILLRIWAACLFCSVFVLIVTTLIIIWR